MDSLNNAVCRRKQSKWSKPIAKPDKYMPLECMGTNTGVTVEGCWEGEGVGAAAVEAGCESL